MFFNIILYNVLWLLMKIDLISNAYFCDVFYSQIFVFFKKKHRIDKMYIAERTRQTNISNKYFVRSHVHVSFPFHLCACMVNYTCFHAHVSFLCVDSFTGDDFLHFCNSTQRTSSTNSRIDANTIKRIQKRWLEFWIDSKVSYNLTE